MSSVTDTVHQRPVKAIQCYLAYGSALFAGYVSYRITISSGLITNPLWIGLLVTCVSTITIWIFSIANGNSSIYDPYWVIAPPLLVLVVKAAGGGLAGHWGPRQIMIFACFLTWSVRYHTFYQWTGWRKGLVHEDWRYEEMRSMPIPYWLNSLLGMHLFPTFLVYGAFIPAALVFSGNFSGRPHPGYFDVAGIAVAMTAVGVQLIADEQLRKHRNSENYSSKLTFRGGLWNYSRHPNYFGEVLFWSSMILFAIGAGIFVERPALVIAGPVAIAVFFRYSSYLMDRRSLSRRIDYEETMKSVSAMVPLPTKKPKLGPAV